MASNDEAGRDPVPNAATDGVSRVYAEALLEAAWKDAKGEPILESLNSLVRDLFQAQPEFEAFLSSMVIPRHEKERVIRAVFDGRSEPLFLNFLIVLNRHDRLILIRQIASAFRNLMEKRLGMVRIKVTTAVPLAADQLNVIKADLRKSLAGEPVVDSRVEPDILGGMVMQVGDWLYDGSVRTKLNRLRTTLLVSSTHEIQSGRDRFGSDA